MAAAPHNVHWSRFTCAIRDGARGHFVPHEGNGYVPHVLRHRVLAGYSAVFVLLKALLIAGYAAVPATAVYSSALTPENVVRLTNLARTAAGLPELAVNAMLGVAAANKAGDMAEKGYFAHTGPDGRGMWRWIRDAGYAYSVAGENLAVHYSDAEGVHDGWMASPTHRQNIVDPRFTEIGVGVQAGTYKDARTTFVVQMFAAPKVTATAVAEPEPAPPAAEPVGAPVIDEAGVSVVPSGKGVEVTARIAKAAVAEVSVGTSVAPMTQGEDGAWRAHVEDVISTESAAEPQQVVVGAANAEGVRVARGVAIMASGLDAGELFVQGGRSVASARMHGLEDGVNRFYAFGIAFLGAALLLKLILAFERRNHHVIAHTLGVITLAAVLLVV